MAELYDDLIARSIALFRLTAGERKKALALLEAMRKELNRKLNEGNLTDFGKRRPKQMLRQANEIISQSYSAINTRLDETLSGLAGVETASTAKILVSLGVTITTPTANAIQSIVSDVLIQGAPSKAWWAKQSEQTQFAFAQQVRQGIAQGEPNAKIVNRVRAVMDVRKRDAAALVHTSVQTVANDARLAVFKANGDAIKGLKQLSTLDGRTSDICMAYSGAEWKLDGTPINGAPAFNGGTPRHFNCRSVIVPILKSFRDLGIDIDEVPEGTRASEEGQVPASTTFEQFLSRKTKEQQDDMLGAGRADLWRDGKITLRDLLDQNGRPLALNELKKIS
jgi:SPP1 gp7 family putative phage head morphogenesis protein